ncbi:39S ribosomal protein L22, mitochondrial [Orchesella cincta]|uniref:Large ribosomal subunit protein uL22m n=1 Tax=Orchesella cincta TaxID=48709 RepID=A0A1D2MTT8_ORCCI|nr:39S ribosomal protein L22, mitochondrial [Orchesella cincta]
MYSMILRRFPGIGSGSLFQQSRQVLSAGGPVVAAPFRSISTTGMVALPYEKRLGPKGWPRYNSVVFPPQSLDEKRRPAYVCHMKTNIKYSPWKMWYVASFIRGMSVDEAILQLSFVNKKGAGFVKQTLLEAQELAVQDHNVEFRSNLWVAESFCTKGVVVKGIRRHARKRVGLVEYFHCHYFVRLEEGVPPKHFYTPQPDGPTLLQRWINDRRSQRVYGSF